MTQGVMSVARKVTALTYPMARIVDRYRRDQGVSAEVAALHERELRRYLYIAACHPGGRWPMVALIDDLWHTFLIYTRDYQRFCDALGVPFLHHEPTDSTPDSAVQQDAYARFLAYYRAEFGDPPKAIWPDRIGEGCDGGGCEQACEGNCAGSG